MANDKDYTLVLGKKLFGPSFDLNKFAISGRSNNDGPLNLVRPNDTDADTPIYSLLSNDEELEQVQVNDNLFLDKADHDKLVLHCRILLDRANGHMRPRLLRRMRRTLREYNAAAVHGLTGDEKAELRGNSPANNNNDYMVLPIVNHKINDMASIISNVVFPPTGMYTAISSKTKMPIAKAVSDEMNKHAQRFAHFTEAQRALVNLLRYNIAAMRVNWEEIYGQKAVANAANGTVAFQRGIIFEGNAIKSIDPFNLFYDSSVSNLNELAQNGEFVAFAKRESIFRLKSRIEAGNYYGSTEFEDEDKMNAVFTTSYPGFYYQPPPFDIEHWEKSECHGDDHRGTDEVNWSDVAAGAAGPGGVPSTYANLHKYGLVEIVELFVRLDADDYGLAPDESNGIETVEEGVSVWRILLLNGRRIILAEPDTAPHGLLPIQVGALFQDENSDMHEKSLAEYIITFQQHTQDILNKLQLAMKKGVLGGLTIYNSKKIALDSSKNPVGGYIPVTDIPENEDIRKYIMQLSNLPDTARTAEQVGFLVDMLEQVAPTRQAQQVADLQRATEFQAAATIAASSKRGLILAKLVDESLFSPLRQMQLMNLYQHSQGIQITDETGQETSLMPSALVSANLEFDISSGLLGLDRLIMSNRLWQVITALIQSNLAGLYDMGALIDYYLTMLGDRTDFKTFKIATPFDALPPEQKQAAVAALEATQGQLTGNNGIAQPSTPNQ